MPGSLTTPGRPRTRDSACERLAFRFRYSVGIREGGSFAARWPAYTLPCRRFACLLAKTNARLGANVGRNSFIATDLHRLLLAGLYRRTPISLSYPASQAKATKGKPVGGEVFGLAEQVRLSCKNRTDGLPSCAKSSAESSFRSTRGHFRRITLCLATPAARAMSLPQP